MLTSHVMLMVLVYTCIIPLVSAPFILSKSRISENPLICRSTHNPNSYASAHRLKKRILRTNTTCNTKRNKINSVDSKPIHQHVLPLSMYDHTLPITLQIVIPTTIYIVDISSLPKHTLYMICRVDTLYHYYCQFDSFF